MKLTDKKADEMVSFSKAFFLDPLQKSIKENQKPSDFIEHIQRQLCVLQTLHFSFLIACRKGNTVASIYGDLKEMSMDTLNNLLRNPGILEKFAALGGIKPAQSTLDTVELFKSLNQAMNKGS